MKNTEKNELVLDCLKEALKKIYPDQNTASKAVVEQTFNHYLSQVGLLGLSDLLNEVLINTLVECGLVEPEFVEDEDEDEDEDVEETPVETVAPKQEDVIVQPSVYTESI